jgi:hypothetical protein
MFMDRSYDPDNTKYGITLATSTDHGITFTVQRVDTGISDPNDSCFFSQNMNGKTTFIGDYNGLAIGPDGVSHLIWTDMRRIIGNCNSEDIVTASIASVPGSPVVGGEIVLTDMSALFIASLSVNASWMVPTLLGLIVGITTTIIRKKIRHG